MRDTLTGSTSKPHPSKEVDLLGLVVGADIATMSEEVRKETRLQLATAWREGT